MRQRFTDRWIFESGGGRTPAEADADSLAEAIGVKEFAEESESLGGHTVFEDFIRCNKFMGMSLPCTVKKSRYVSGDCVLKETGWRKNRFSESGGDTVYFVVYSPSANRVAEVSPNTVYISDRTIDRIVVSILDGMESEPEKTSSLLRSGDFAAALSWLTDELMPQALLKFPPVAVPPDADNPQEDAKIDGLVKWLRGKRPELSRGEAESEARRIRDRQVWDDRNYR